MPGVVDRKPKAHESPAYVRLSGKYSSVTLGKLPPGTSQKAGGTFIKFLSKTDAKDFICETMNLPNGIGSGYFLQMNGRKVPVVISHDEATCAEKGDWPDTSRPRYPVKELWTKLVV